MVVELNLELKQMDVKTTSLYGDLDKTIYMKQPKGFEERDGEDYVYKLIKSSYGLKKSLR